MKWMREYQQISELVIRVMNKYSYMHKKQLNFGEDKSISFSEAQVIEEIIRNRDSNMSALAKELGVTKAAITKTMKKLESKGFIKRYKNLDNNKDIFMSLTDLGDRTYKIYQKYIYENLFKEIYEMLDNESESSHDILHNFFKKADISLQKIREDKV